MILGDRHRAIRDHAFVQHRGDDNKGCGRPEDDSPEVRCGYYRDRHPTMPTDWSAVDNAHMIPNEKGGWTAEPELDQAWPDRIKLRWHAALVRDETGLNVTVGKARYWRGGIPQRGYYSINMQYGRTSSGSGPFTYGSAWTYLNGIRAGAQAVRGQVGL